MAEQRSHQTHLHAFWGPYGVLFAISTILIIHFSLSLLFISTFSFVAHTIWDRIFSVSLQVSFIVSAWVFGPGLRQEPIKLKFGSLGFRWIDKYKLAGYSVVTLLGSLTLSGTAVFIMSELGLNDIPAHLPQGLTTANLILTFVLLVFLTPVTEEVFFRGFIFRGLAVSWGIWPAAVSSSAIFCLMHGSIALIVPTFLSGLILTWSLRKSGSLWPGIVAHMAQNTVYIGAMVTHYD